MSSFKQVVVFLFVFVFSLSSEFLNFKLSPNEEYDAKMQSLYHL